MNEDLAQFFRRATLWELERYAAGGPANDRVNVPEKTWRRARREAAGQVDHAEAEAFVRVVRESERLRHRMDRARRKERAADCRSADCKSREKAA